MMKRLPKKLRRKVGRYLRRDLPCAELYLPTRQGWYETWYQGWIPGYWYVK